MFKMKYIMITAFAGLVLGGCKKEYLDINTNPNTATESVITPDLAMAAQLTSSAGRNASSYDVLARWLGYWSASGDYSRSTVEMSYNITTDSYTGLWEGGFYTAGQYKSIEKKSKELGWTYYEGISKIMGAMEMMNIVDIYNNLPYTTAFDLAGNIRPTYDKGEDVYKALFAQIDAGIGLIKGADVNLNRNIGKQDIMFGGDKVKWAKFGNTLKLKMLLHTVNTTTFNAQAEIAKISAEGSGFIGNGLSAEVQPGYTSDRPNPFYAAHLFNAQNGNESDNYNRANNFSLNLLSGLNDIRATYIYRAPKNGGGLKGTDYGANANAANCSNCTSGIGTGIGKSFTMPMWVMTSVEAQFLIAEATIRGWISGDAQAAYSLAVTESFKWLMGAASGSAAATDYLATGNTKITWPATGTLQDKLAVMAWQKYIGLNGIGMLESWNDVRRLGVVQPPLSIAPERGSNPIPVRLLYPSSEYNYNSANVKAEGTINQFTSKVFWHK